MRKLQQPKDKDCNVTKFQCVRIIRNISEMVEDGVIFVLVIPTVEGERTMAESPHNKWHVYQEPTLSGIGQHSNHGTLDLGVVHTCVLAVVCRESVLIFVVSNP